MAFDFLPSNPTPPKPNTEESSGGNFSVGKNYFFDTYKNHLDAHTLFSTPPLRSEFNLQSNFEDCRDRYFNVENIKYRIENRADWYGKNIEFDKLIAGYTEFQEPKLLSDTLDKINNEINESMFSGIEKPKMRINDRFGIFSFDLASMAMSYVFEYFTEKTNEKVDGNFVKKVDGKFIYTKTNEIVIQKIKRRENGNPTVISSVRKCFIDFEKKDKQDRSVEIFILNSFASGEKASDLIYNSMAAISVAQNLLLKGFKVKLTGLLVVKNDDDETFSHFVPAKRFNQPLDINAAAYVCGDPAFFRYQGFKMIAKGFEIHSLEIPGGLGTIINDTKIVSNIIESDYVKNSTLKQADTRLYFGGSRSLNQAKKEVETAIEILNSKYSENGNNNQN